MSLRSNWEGFLRFNLISVPVRAFNAAAPARGKIGFHLLHKDCNQRIRYQKVCPVHGEVSKDEIVSGYEFAKGEYVVIDPKELEKMRPGSDKTINVTTFIKPEALDPIYFTERSYYLIPAGKVGQMPFAVLQKVMEEEERYAVAQVVFAGREQMVLIRPLQGLLAMTMLSFYAQIKQPSVLDDEVPEIKPPAKELELARTLIEAATAEDFDYAEYKDTYTSQVKELIEAKVAGKKIVASAPEEEPQVINLMDALKRSLSATKKHHGPKARAKHARTRHAAKRKTG